jgi:hypothetical protein
MATNKPEKLNLTKRIFLFVLTLALTNCQDSESPIKEEQSRIKTVSIDDAKAFLTRSSNSPSAKLASSEIGDLEFDKATQEKLNGSDQLLTAIPLATNNEVRNDRVVVMKIDNEIRSVIFSMQPDENSTQDRFSGKVFIYSLEGDFITGYGAKDGIYIGQYLKEKSNSKTSKNPQDGEGGVLIIYYYKKPVNAVNATDFDAIWGSAGSSMGWAPVGGASGVTWDATGGGGGGSGITAPTNEQIAAALEKKIDGTNLDPCTQGVLDKLKNLKQGDIAAMINRFNAGGSIFTIHMSTGAVTITTDLAQTKPMSGSSTDINMVFSNDYISGKGNLAPPTDLSVATTMTHEIIHAYLISQLEEYKSGGCAGICDFATIYDAYVKQQIDKDKNKNLTVQQHHEVIANDYVNAIASTIEEFHTGQPVTSGFPKQVYLDMAWGGLDKTYIFNKNYPDDPNNKNYKDRQRILARINTERLGSQYGVNTPIGTPCKK